MTVGMLTLNPLFKKNDRIIKLNLAFFSFCRRHFLFIGEVYTCIPYKSLNNFKINKLKCSLLEINLESGDKC